jgi:hypothetical protein
MGKDMDACRILLDPGLCFVAIQGEKLPAKYHIDPPVKNPTNRPRLRGIVVAKNSIPLSHYMWDSPTFSPAAVPALIITVNSAAKTDCHLITCLSISARSLLYLHRNHQLDVYLCSPRQPVTRQFPQKTSRVDEPDEPCQTCNQC